MRINKDSFAILNKSETPSVFRVNISEETVKIEEKVEGNLYGDVLVFSDSMEDAFDIGVQYRDVIDYLLFFDKESQKVVVLGEPEKPVLSIEEIFGRIQKIFKDFEERKEQVKLSKEIENCLEEGKFGIFEAPTGTGKSLAYLIPSILYAKKHSLKVVVSTNTINLQRQLMEKDLPVLKNIIDFNAKVALGRSNYLCKRKVDSIFEKGNLFLFEDGSYEKLKSFVNSTKTGVKAEFFTSDTTIDETLWESVASTSLTCAHTKCPYYKNRCFYYKARALLESADLIVANHHIVLSDALVKEAGVLPDYDAVIFDEAHNLEKNATNYFTQTVSTAEISKLLDRLYIKKKRKEAGLLSDIAEDKNKTECVSYIKEVRRAIEDVLEFFGGFKQDEITVNADNLYKIKPHINALSDTVSNLSLKLKHWKDSVDISAIAQSLSDYSDALNLFFENEVSDIKWIKKTKTYVHFNITPLSISEALRENIYERAESVIFTSATISVNGNFDFFKKTVGVDAANKFIAENNFDYDSTSKLVITSDTPFPDSPEYANALSKCIVSIAKGIKDIDAGALILFTSYRMLNKTYELSCERLESLGFVVLRQGDFDNFETLKEFKKNRSFLFATSSFWEGIDVKGDALSIVFITRLPFEVPNTPVESSRYEVMKRQGVNAFIEYSLPKAVLKFRQGFGRLIRDKNDRGVILVTDSRIIRKTYGKVFVDSLPKLKKEVIKTNEIKDSICSFFGSC